MKKFNTFTLAEVFHPAEKSCKIAFTLAEVLITLGIIGVVAALTMPSLIAKHQEKRRIVQLKKAYSVLSQAYQNVITEYGTLDTWGLAVTNTGKVDENNKPILNRSGQYELKKRLEEHLKTTEYHEDLDAYTLNNKKFKFGYEAKDISIQTVDGIAYEIGYITNCNPACGEIWIQLTNEKRRLGVSYFAFDIQKNKLQPKGINDPGLRWGCDINNKQGADNYQYGKFCTAWALINENMDYLHCDDLSWNGKRKCN